MRKFFITLLSICCATFSQGQQRTFLPTSANQACQQWVNQTMREMGLKEQVGQLFVYAVDGNNTSTSKRAITQTLKKVGPGAVLFSNGKLNDQASLTNYAQSASSIPMLIAFEGEWGAASQLLNTPNFPKNAALGCIQDDVLIEAYGKEVARELRELGVHINFAPVADIMNNPENPSIYERSFGSVTQHVADKVLLYSKGLQSGGILPVLKHFPGGGDTKTNSDLSMPIIPYPRARLDTVELYPFKKAFEAGIGGVMVGHLIYTELDPDHSNAASFSPSIINGLLKDELNFKGLVFSEALYKRNVAGTPHLEVRALKAGNDMILVNGDLEKIQQDILLAIKKGELSEKEIKEKCRKVLTYKYMLGLNKRPATVATNGLEARINSKEAINLVSDLRKKAVTVLANYGNILPLSGAANVAVVSLGNKDTDKAFLANLDKQVSSDKFRLTVDADDKRMKQIAGELSKYNRVIISVTTDDQDIKHFTHFLSDINTKTPLVYVFFSPYRELLPAVEPLSKASAVILAHSAQEELQQLVADAMLGKASITGRLSMPIGNLFGVKSGIDLTPATPAAGFVVEDFGMKSYVFHRGLDSIITAGVDAGAFPGCQVLVLKNGKPVYDKVFGVHSDKDNTPVRATDLFDLADLSQTTGTLLAIMKLYETGRIRLTDKASQYVSALRGGNKKDITIEALLFHESGLGPHIRFYRETIDENTVRESFTQGWPDQWHQTRVGEFSWVSNDFKFKRGLISDHQTPTHRLHVADNMWLANSFKNTMMQSINQSPMDTKKRYVYSPAGFILLQLVVESITQKPLDEYLEAEFFAPMGLSRTKYLPLRYFTKAEIMPTASNEYFRRQDLCGYVHDELAACQGGISGNAGLFSTAHEVGRIHQMILNGGELDGKRYLKEETCKLFTTKKSSIGRRGLGFDKPTVFDPENPLESPCSISTPLEVYGIAGFTGTCAWTDPTNNLVYVFLSNRVCPEVWNDKIIRMNILQNIQEVLYKSME
jgi:Beta-glucosidase-related glycosidases